MYGHENDDTGELPRFEPQQSWTFDRRTDNQPEVPYQSPFSPDETTAGFAVPSSHRVRGRYADGHSPGTASRTGRHLSARRGGVAGVRSRSACRCWWCSC